MTRNDSIRREILFHLYAVRPAAHLASTIQREARKQGLDYTQREIHSECDFLSGDKLIERLEAPGSTEPIWKITAAGVRHYEQTYAA